MKERERRDQRGTQDGSREEVATAPTVRPATSLSPPPTHDLLGLQSTCGNRAVVGMLAATPAPPIIAQRSSSQPTIHRYFDLKQATQARMNVTAKQGTMFPGHEKDGANVDFLKGTTGAGAVNRVNLAAIPDLAVSDDGKMAVESAAIDGNREVEAFFASKSVIAAGKAALKTAKSEFTLSAESSEGVTVPDLATNAQHALQKVVGAKAGTYVIAKRPKGDTLQGLEQCIEMAEAVIGSKMPKLLLAVVGDDPSINTRDIGQQMLLYLGAYIAAFQKGGAHEGNHAESQKVAAAALKAPLPTPPPKQWDAPVVQVVAASKEKIVEFTRGLGKHSGRNQYKPVFTTNREEPKLVDGKWKMEIQVIREDWADRWDSVLEDGDVRPHIESYKLLGKESQTKPLDTAEASALLEARKVTLIQKINGAPEIFQEINKELGMNEHANPGVGQGYEIFHKGDGSKATFPYHFAGVVAKSGPDTVTFENYARDRKSSTGADQRMYFQMYGPKREVTDTTTGIEHAKPGKGETAAEQEERELAAGSFHGKWKGIFAEAQTLGISRPGK